MVYQYNLRLAARPKSGGPSLGRNPGAHKQRRPALRARLNFGEIGSTQFLEQGMALLFSFERLADGRAASNAQIGIPISLVSRSTFR
jgi:hypothetical protein